MEGEVRATRGDPAAAILRRLGEEDTRAAVQWVAEEAHGEAEVGVAARWAVAEAEVVAGSQRDVGLAQRPRFWMIVTIPMHELDSRRAAASVL